MSILALTSDTLIGTPATGNIEYNGQFFGTDSNAARGQLQRITQTTAVASTSGTSVEFTAIPAWAKKITVMLNGVSSASTGIIQVQLGTGSTSYTISGYLGATITNATIANITTGFAVNVSAGSAAAGIIHGLMTITNVTGNTWVASGTFAQSQAANVSYMAYSVPLGAALTAVRVIASATGSPSDTFDAGNINILYEG
jgi:hypothetical protein